MNRGCAHRYLGSAPYPTPAETRWTGTPATVHLSGLDTGALTAHVVDRHMQPSRRFTRKADDLPWSVLAHASSVVTRGRLASGSHGLRWRAREGSFGIPGPCWPGAVLSIADPAGQRSHLRVYGRPARAALTAGGSPTPANAPQWPQEPLSRDTEGVKVSCCWYHPPDLRRAVGFLKFPLRRVPASSRYRPYRATVDPARCTLRPRLELYWKVSNTQLREFRIIGSVEWPRLHRGGSRFGAVPADALSAPVG